MKISTNIQQTNTKFEGFLKDFYKPRKNIFKTKKELEKSIRQLEQFFSTILLQELFDCLKPTSGRNLEDILEKPLTVLYEELIGNTEFVAYSVYGQDFKRNLDKNDVILGLKEAIWLQKEEFFSIFLKNFGAFRVEIIETLTLNLRLSLKQKQTLLSRVLFRQIVQVFYQSVSSFLSYEVQRLHHDCIVFQTNLRSLSFNPKL